MMRFYYYVLCSHNNFIILYYLGTTEFVQKKNASSLPIPIIPPFCCLYRVLIIR